MARKQRQFTAQFKLETVMEVLRGEKPIAHICRERAVTDSLVYSEFLEKAAGIFEGKITSQEASEGSGRIAALERWVGQLTMENALLKKGSSWLEAARRRNGQ